MSSFMSRHKQDWEELEELVRLGRKSIRKLRPEQRQRLDTLYRRTTVHLARVTTMTNDPHLTEYLNGLAAAAHSLIYLPPRRSPFAGATAFVTSGFARVIARSGAAHLTSAMLFFVGATVGYFAALADPLMMHALWPAGDLRQPGSSPEQLLGVLRSGRDQGGGAKFQFTSMLFQHNLKVGLLAMATGILASVPTVFLMLFNGVLIGVFAAIHHQAGIYGEMWAWILPHGITEIGAIILCGGVGLMLGQAVVRPGLRTRQAALTAAGREAALTCIGVIGMLAVAAVIESYVRQSHWSTGARFAFAAATAVFWIAYAAHGYRLESLNDCRYETTTDSDTKVAELAKSFGSA